MLKKISGYRGVATGAAVRLPDGREIEIAIVAATGKALAQAWSALLPGKGPADMAKFTPSLLIQADALPEAWRPRGHRPRRPTVAEGILEALTPAPLPSSISTLPSPVAGPVGNPGAVL